MTDSQKLDFLVSTVTEMKASLDIAVKRVAALEVSVDTLSKTVATLREEVTTLKIRDNRREQQARGLSLRLFNFPGSDSETDLKSKIYEKLLKPILAAAKSKGDLPTLPQVNTTIDQCYRIGRFAAGANKPPPPIIVIFSSAAVRMAVLRNKRGNIPSTDYHKRMVLSEDLTPPTHRKLKEMIADERVAKVWTRDGTIWYVQRGDNMPAKIVKNVFDSLESILT